MHDLASAPREGQGTESCNVVTGWAHTWRRGVENYFLRVPLLYCSCPATQASKGTLRKLFTKPLFQVTAQPGTCIRNSIRQSPLLISLPPPPGTPRPPAPVAASAMMSLGLSPARGPPTTGGIGGLRPGEPLAPAKGLPSDGGGLEAAERDCGPGGGTRRSSMSSRPESRLPKRPPIGPPMWPAMDVGIEGGSGNA